MSDDIFEHKIYNEEAWEWYLQAERRGLELRRNGHLRKSLGAPLAGESAEELERLASEDEARARRGFVELSSPEGEPYYKHIDELTPKDRVARGSAESRWVQWLAERRRRR